MDIQQRLSVSDVPLKRSKSGVDATTVAQAAASSNFRRSSVTSSESLIGNVTWILITYAQILWKKYLWSLEHRPVWSKSMTSAVISFISELLAQWLSGGWSKCPWYEWYDCCNWTSVRDQTLIGFFMRGAPLHYWYLCLTWLFRKYDGSDQRRRKREDGGIELTSPSEVKVESAYTQKRESSGELKELEPLEPREPLWVTMSKVVVDQLTYGPFTNWLYFYVIGFMEGRSIDSIQALVDRDFASIMIANWKVLFGNLISIVWTTWIVMKTRM